MSQGIAPMLPWVDFFVIQQLRGILSRGHFQNTLFDLEIVCSWPLGKYQGVLSVIQCLKSTTRLASLFLIPCLLSLFLPASKMSVGLYDTCIW